MEKQFSKIKLASITFGVLVICFAFVNLASAWTAPTATPPGNNAPAPLNVGNVGQIKYGAGLVLNALDNGAHMTNGLLIPYGRVGIGTMSPDYMLEIEGTSARAFLTNISTAQYSSALIGFKNFETSDASNFQWIFQKNTAGGATGNSTLMGRMTSNGNARDVIQFESNGNTSFNNWKQTAATYGNVIIANGYVGIGTTSPTQKLEIVGGNTKTTGGLIIQACTPSGTGDGRCPSSPALGQMWLDTTIQ